MSGTACALCGGSERHVLFPMPDGFRVEECRACGLAATEPAVPADEIGRWYPARYYGDTNRRFHPLLERLIPRFRMRRAREVERRTGTSGGRMLDVGCGRGLLPALMRARGWEAEGVEISDDASRHAREVLGLQVFVGPFVAYPGAASSFDAVVVWHVLEHLPDPRAALAKAHALLKPGGLLMVAVPNFESAQAAFAGPHWFHLDVPRHYFHFRLRVLARLLAEAGFEVESVSHFNLEQNPYGWIQSLLNRLGFRFNLLYDVLKQPAARSGGHPLRERPLETLLMAAALVPIVPISFALFLLEVAARRGGTVEVYARKR